MGLSYKQSSVPATLREGEFAVVDGVTYVGNSDNEPVPAKGYKELVFTQTINPDGSAGTTTVVTNELEDTPTVTKSSTGLFDITGITGISTSGYRSVILVGPSTPSNIASVIVSYRSPTPTESYRINMRDYSGSLADPSGTATLRVSIRI